MKIIKAGRAQEKQYTGKCRVCGCEFQFEAHEAKEEPGERSPGQSYTDLIVECPTEGCGNLVRTMK